MTPPVLLSLRSLAVTYPNGLRALRGLDLDVRRGTCLALAGESGSGKSTLARSLLGLNPDATTGGGIHLGDTRLHELGSDDWRSVRWKRIAITLQATTSLDPVMTVEDQVVEPMLVHRTLAARAARERARELLADVGLGDWVLERRPGQLSGGQRRSVGLAIARACDPELLVLDEPTSALDPVARRRTIDLLARLRDGGTTLIVCTHDISLIDELADDAAFLYQGWLAERGPSRELLREPRSPYGRGLLNAVPTLWNRKELRGIRSSDGSSTAGCPFADRCAQVVEPCRTTIPVLQPLADAENRERLVACVRGGIVERLRASGVVKRYRNVGRSTPPAVDGVDVTLRAGEVVGIIGGNGAGKSTLATMLTGLVAPDAGGVHLDGIDVANPPRDRLLELRRTLQLVQQDPYDALSPVMTIAESVSEPLEIHGIGDDQERDATVRRALAEVRLPVTDEFLERRTSELSGGQLQRVALARALVLTPEVLVLDEPVSMLDPSEQAETLQLLKGLQTARGISMIVVSHDIAVVARLADRVVVLHDGKVVEHTTGDGLLRDARHPVTRALLSAAGLTAVSPEAEPPPSKEPTPWTAAVS